MDVIWRSNLSCERLRERRITGRGCEAITEGCVIPPKILAQCGGRCAISITPTDGCTGPSYLYCADVSSLFHDGEMVAIRQQGLLLDEIHKYETLRASLITQMGPFANHTLWVTGS